MTMLVDSKDVWINDEDILGNYESISNSKVAEKARKFDNNIKAMKKELATLAQKLKTLLFILNDTIIS